MASSRSRPRSTARPRSADWPHSTSTCLAQRLGLAHWRPFSMAWPSSSPTRRPCSTALLCSTTSLNGRRLQRACMALSARIAPRRHRLAQRPRWPNIHAHQHRSNNEQLHHAIWQPSIWLSRATGSPFDEGWVPRIRCQEPASTEPLYGGRVPRIVTKHLLTTFQHAVGYQVHSAPWGAGAATLTDFTCERASNSASAGHHWLPKLR